MPTPGALGQDDVPSRHFWLYTLIYVVCGVAGIVFLFATGAIRFANRAPEAPMAVPLAHDEADGSEDSDASALRDEERRERYRYCELGEASDPEVWMEVRHGGSPEDSSSTDWGFTENPAPGACIQAIDTTDVGNVAICSFLFDRSTRRLQEARDSGADQATVRFYLNAVETLDDAYSKFANGELNNNSVETRNILRDFARFSPRADSPTARLSADDIANELRHYENNQRALDDDDAMDVDGDGDHHMGANLNGIHNNTHEIGPEAEGPVYGPLDHNDTLLEEIHTQRARVLAEIEDHLAGPLTQEDQWYWEAQRDWWYAVP